MARRTKRWSYSTGERGRNRVRAFEHASGVLMLEFSDRGKRTRISLGHRDRERAKRAADEAAAKLGTAEDLKPDEITLGQLFDIYGREVTPRKAASTQKHDRRAMRMFRRYFRPDRTVASLGLRDWDRFIADRRSGRLSPNQSNGRPVGDRIVEQDLRLLLAVFNWAAMAGDGRGGILLNRNPFKGYKVPKEKNPRRVVATQAEYEALLGIASLVDWRFRLSLVLAHETGHRIGAILNLWWTDIDFDSGLIR